MLALGSTLACAAVSACGDEPPTHAALSWQLRCDSGPTCDANDHQPHVVNHFDGEAEHSVRCSVSSAAGGGQRLSVSARRVDADQDYGVSIRATVSTGSLVSSDDCVIDIIDEFTHYTGDCSPNPPGSSEPCRLFDVVVSEAAIEGKLQCVGLPSMIDMTETRLVTDPSSASTPVGFLFENCG